MRKWDKSTQKGEGKNEGENMVIMQRSCVILYFNQVAKTCNFM